MRTLSWVSLTFLLAVGLETWSPPGGILHSADILLAVAILLAIQAPGETALVLAGLASLLRDGLSCAPPGTHAPGFLLASAVAIGVRRFLPPHELPAALCALLMGGVTADLAYLVWCGNLGSGLLAGVFLRALVLSLAGLLLHWPISQVALRARFTASQEAL